MSWIQTDTMTNALLLLASVMLVATGCAAPQVERELKQVKAHAERDVAVVETVDQKGDEYTHVYYQCKKDGESLTCTKACGDKFKCPTNPGLVNASVSPEARGGMKAGDSSGGATGAGMESGDKGETSGPMDKTKESVTDDSGDNGTDGMSDDESSDDDGDDSDADEMNGDEEADGNDGADSEGGM